MIPETISTLEVIRFAVAIAGLRAAWTGRVLVKRSLAAIPTDPTDDIYERLQRQQRDGRMVLFEAIQFGIMLVHSLLLVNVLVNFGYPSGPIEQPNVMTSNVAQILIPIILTRLSEMLSLEMQAVVRLHAVVGRRPTEEAAP